VAEAGPAERLVAAGGLTVYGRDWGGAGRPIALVHGLASNARIWDLVAPRLIAHGRVIAFDQRGHGRSGKPDTGYDARTVAADLHAALAQLAPPASTVVVGHSWGATVALQWAADFPGEVAGVVCVDGGLGGWDLDPALTWDRLLQRLSPPRLNGVPAARLLGQIRQGRLGEVWSDAVEAAVLGNFERHGDGTVAPRLTRERHLAILRSMWEQPVVGLYPRVRCPARFLMVRHDGDSERAALSERAAARARVALADVQIVWLDDTIHDVPLHRPAAVAEAIAAFLAALPPGAGPAGGGR